MSKVELEILSPANGKVFVGVTELRLQGRLLSTGDEPLYHKWYSSLHLPPAEALPNAALNKPEDNPFDFKAALGVGSHILTFTAKDVAGDDLDSLKQVKRAGIAGGPEGTPHPCIIHFFHADIHKPETEDTTLNKFDSALEAVAPSQWGKKKDDRYVRDEDNYHQINRVYYRWRFEPIEAGLFGADLPPAHADPEQNKKALDEFQKKLQFDIIGAAELTPIVRYQGPLPERLQAGRYKLILRVEDKNNGKFGHEMAREVFIAA